MDDIIGSARTTMSFGELVGVTVASESDSEVTCRLAVGDAHLNQALIGHGGVLFTLADTALGLLTSSGAGSTSWVSTSFDLQLFRGVGVGDVVLARARHEHQSRRLRSCRVDITREDGTPVGLLTNQAMALPPRGVGHATPDRVSLSRAVDDPLGRAMAAARRRTYGDESGPGRTAVIASLDGAPVGTALLEEHPPHAAHHVWVPAHCRHTAVEAALVSALAGDHSRLFDPPA